jgi:hypothetical protein
MRKTFFFLLPIILIGMILTACGTRSTQASKNSTHSIKEWIQVGDYDIFVHQIIVEKEVVDNKRLVYIEVEYANQRSAEELSCRVNQWVLYDSQGYSYEAKSSRNLYENKNVQYLGSDRFLSQNMQLRGWLAFEIPENAILKRIQFITAFLGTKTADILVDEPK